MKKILVADDSITIQKVIALTFAEEPYEIESVGTGSDALEKIKEWRPDILLADVIMPQMNGYELCRAVKNQESTMDMPVLLLAGTFEAFDEEEARSANADGYITKPFESGELIEKVKSLLEEDGEMKEAVAQPIPDAEEVPAPPPEVSDQALHAKPLAQEEPQADTETFADVKEEADKPDPGKVDWDELTALEDNGPKVQASSQEPDIWDILSEASEEQAADESSRKPPEPEPYKQGLDAINGMGVVDFGSFDVGLDRKDQAVDQGIPVSEAPVERKPFENGLISEPPEQVIQTGVEGKSKVEVRERDFFGLETDKEDQADIHADEAVLDDAIEEISFELDEPDIIQQSEGARTGEPSFLESEPFDDGIQPLSDEDFPELQEPEEILEVQPMEIARDRDSMMPMELGERSAEPSEPEAEAVAHAVAGPPISGAIPYSPAAETPSDAQREMRGGSSGEGSTAGGDRDVRPDAALPLSGEQIPWEEERLKAMVKDLVEEKVEKIVWEVIPDLAEILIREAIEKIKGGS